MQSIVSQKCLKLGELASKKQEVGNDIFTREKEKKEHNAEERNKQDLRTLRWVRRATTAWGAVGGGMGIIGDVLRMRMLRSGQTR